MTDAFKSLVASINDLEKGLGVDSLTGSDITAEFIESSQVRAKSLIILGHAYLEKYFETIAFSIALSSFNGYKDGTVTKPFLALVATVQMSRDMPNGFDDSRQGREIQHDAWFYRALKSYKHVVNHNHGIKEENIFSLFWPLGLLKEDFGESLLPLLESYGQKRGSIAHTGSVGTTNMLNILEERNLLSNLVDKVRCFDSRICDLNLVSSAISLSEVESELRKA